MRRSAIARSSVPDFSSPAVADAYASLPAKLRKRVLGVRDLIFEVAAQDDRIGLLEETLKWGVPSYLPVRSRVGTTVRLQGFPDQERFGIFVHCQTTLVSTYRELYSRVLNFEGKRAIIFDETDEIPTDPLHHCIALALTYHLDKRQT